MRIALCGPVHVDALSSLLHVGDVTADLPRADGGTPVSVLARALVEAGHEVLVVALDPATAHERIFEGPRLRIRVAPERRNGRGRDAFRLERASVERMLREERFDVVHAHWTYEYALAAQRLGRPLVITAHDWAPTILRLRPDLHRGVRAGMSVLAVARSRHLTVPSPYLEHRFRTWARRRPVMIPNALADEAFLVVAPAARPGPGPLILAVNQGWGRRKNVDALLAAHALLRRRMPDARLRLVGTGYAPGGPAARWAAEHALAEGVEFIGGVSLAEVRAQMAAADLFVHPSIEESFGLVLIEAMAQRTPVLGGRRSGAVPWVLDGGRAGGLVDVTDHRALADRLEALLSDQGTLDDLAERGYAHAWACFRIGALIPRYLACYERAVRG